MAAWRENSDFGLLVRFLTPSWGGALFMAFVGAAVIGLTVLLTHVGGTVQQSLLGLHGVYDQSTVGNSVGTLNARFSNNTMFNNILLFLMWGSIGLVVYSVVQSVLNEFRNADTLLHELDYVHVNRRNLLLSVFARSFIRIVAFAGWWLLLRNMVYHVLPYAIATAHDSALHLTDSGDWMHSLLAGALCALGTYGLIVLARLTVMRPRLFGNEVGA